MMPVAFFCPWSFGWALTLLDTGISVKHCVAERKNIIILLAVARVSWGTRCLSFGINLPNLLEDPLRFHFQTWKPLFLLRIWRDKEELRKEVFLQNGGRLGSF